MLKYFPLYLDIQKSGIWKRRFEASAHYAEVTGDTHSFHPDVLLEELTGKTVLLAGYGAIGQEIERMLAPFNVKMLRVARSARTAPEVHAVPEVAALLGLRRVGAAVAHRGRNLGHAKAVQGRADHQLGGLVLALLQRHLGRKRAFELVLTGVRYFGPRAAHSVFPALNKFANMRYAPGTPAGSSRNQESAVNTYAPLP